MKPHGTFIVFEGIDGAGTTTQIARYAQHLRKSRRLVHVTSEPSAGPVGSLLRQALSGRVALGSSHQAQTMALLFAADRLDHLSHEIEPYLRESAVVLCDRYDLSSLAYQTATVPSGALEGVDIEAWVRSTNRFATRPDATVIVHVTPAVAERRRRSRTGAPELYELSELQVRFAALYRQAARLVPGDRIIDVEGDGDVDTVAESIRRALEPIVSQ